MAIGDILYDADSSKNPNRRGAWSYLKNTAYEIACFDSICNKSGINPHISTRLNPTEASIRSISGHSPEIMLIATHGFYFTNERASLEPFYVSKHLASEDGSFNNPIPPLLRGGLILADANPVWTNEVERADDIDGVLTAAEISELNLNNTQLMILSACETGLGETEHLLGVNGLQRGLKLAGVKSIIMSLWEVNDKAAQEFMQTFYSELFNQGDRYDAFHNARLKMQNKYPQNPAYWAPFVMLD